MSRLRTTILTTALLLLTSPAFAQSYRIGWWTIDSGGGVCTDGIFATIHGTIGQPDACTPMIGADFALVGGFWANPGRCPADWNHDGFISGQDFDEYVLDFENGDADFDDDGFTSGIDFDLFVQAFELGC